MRHLSKSKQPEIQRDVRENPISLKDKIHAAKNHRSIKHEPVKKVPDFALEPKIQSQICDFAIQPLINKQYEVQQIAIRPILNSRLTTSNVEVELRGNRAKVEATIIHSGAHDPNRSDKKITLARNTKHQEVEHSKSYLSSDTLKILTEGDRELSLLSDLKKFDSPKI